MPEDKDKNPYEELMEIIQKQADEIKELKAQNKEIIDFNKALLNRNGTHRVTKEVDDSNDEAKKKLEKYLEEN